MLTIIKKGWANEFLKGSIFLTASSFSINILNYLFNFLAARSLGPQGYSEIITLFSYVSIIAVPTSVFSTFIIQKIASEEKSQIIVAKSLEQFLWQNIKNYWFVFILLISFIPFVSRLTNLSSVSGFVLIPLIIISFITSFYGAAMQGLRLFFMFGLISLFAAILKLLGAILTFFGIDGLYTIIFFILASAVIPAIVGILIFKKHLRTKVTKHLPKIQKSLASLLHNRQLLLISFSTLALVLLNNVDIIFVKKYLSSSEAGIYAPWSLFAKIIFYAVGPFIAISFIFFSGSKQKQHKTFGISILTLLLVSLASYVVYTYFTSTIITLLFGEKFIKVSPYLSQASIFGSIYAGIIFINNYYLAKRSYASLILPLLIPLYIVGLFFVQKQISSIITFNIYFSAVVLFFYLFVYVRSLLHFDSKSAK